MNGAARRSIAALAGVGDTATTTNTSTTSSNFIAKIIQNRKIRAQCKSFRRTLDRATAPSEAQPLDADFVRRFNEFVTEYPRALEEWGRNKHGGKSRTTTTLLAALHSYLLHAIHQKYPLEAFQDLVIQTPTVLAETTTKWETTLLHHVCFDNPNAFDIIALVVEQFPDAPKMKSLWRNTPLHYACYMNAPLPVIRLLVRENPRAIHRCNRIGNTPLHYASKRCRGVSSLDAVRYLATLAPGTCFLRNKYGRMPADCCAKKMGRRNNNSGVFEFLTKATEVAATALMERLHFSGPSAVLPPREMFAMVAMYFDVSHVLPVHVSMVKLALSANEIEVLFRRRDIREEFFDRI